MKKNIVITLFICVSVIQIITPISMIAKREATLRNGKQFKFKTMAVDPYDAFRGRYVALRIEENKVPVSKESKINRGQNVYALINIDEQGFAKLTTLTISKPEGESYIKARVRYVSGNEAYLDLPLDRYYMEEKAAPAAEKIYLRHAQGNKQDAYIIVRIKDGFAVIESLYVGGQRIEDAVKQQMKR